MLLVKLIEPPCTERYARWCERSEFLLNEKFLLLDFIFKCHLCIIEKTNSANAICSAQVRAQITKPEAIETFRQFQNFINANFQVSELTMREFEAHEQGCRRALNILLYGVIEREEKK